MRYDITRYSAIPVIGADHPPGGEDPLELCRVEQAALADQREDAATAAQGLLGDRAGGRVAEIGVESRRDADRGLDRLLHPRPVHGYANDAAGRQQLATGGEVGEAVE